MGPWDSAQPCPLAPRAGGDPDPGGQCSGHLLEKSRLRASVICPLHVSIPHIPCPEPYKHTFDGKDATSQIPFCELRGRDSLQHGRDAAREPSPHRLCVHTYVCPVPTYMCSVSVCLCVTPRSYVYVRVCACAWTQPPGYRTLGWRGSAPLPSPPSLPGKTRTHLGTAWVWELWLEPEPAPRLATALGQAAY